MAQWLLKPRFSLFNDTKPTFGNDNESFRICEWNVHIYKFTNKSRFINHFLTKTAS